MTAILDLNDAAFTLTANGASHRAPAYAYFDGQGYRFGNDAASAVRRAPRDVNTRFWSQLSTQPLHPPLGSARHSADLAHAHLSALYQQANKPSTLLLVVPGTLTTEQISLALGILQTLPIQVQGIVHRSAVLGAALGAIDAVHVEAQLHQSALTPLTVQGYTVQAGDTQVLPGWGLLKVYERIAGLVSKAFIEQTRFDPQRSADSEQSLHAQLPDLLETLSLQAETLLSLNGYQARIDQQTLQEVGQAFSAQLAASLPASDCVVILDPLLGALPGLDIPNPLRIHDSQTIVETLQDMGSQIHQAPDGLTFQSALPPTPQSTMAAQDMPEGGPPPVEQLEMAPSHLVVGHQLFTLTQDYKGPGFSLRKRSEGVQLDMPTPLPLTINGLAAQPGQNLKAGDVLVLEPTFRGLCVRESA